MWKEIKKKKIKARVNKDIRKIIESEEVFFKPVRVCNFWNNNYIEYESNGDEKKLYQSNNTSMELNYI